MSRLRLCLGFAWALPTSLIGLLLAVLGGAKPYALRRGCVLQFVGAWSFWGWWYRPTSPWAALTLGFVTIFNERFADNETCLKHECVHVSQAMRLGVFFLPWYGLLSLWAALHGQDAYRGNRLEVAAYRRQDEPEWPF